VSFGTILRKLWHNVGLATNRPRPIQDLHRSVTKKVFLPLKMSQGPQTFREGNATSMVPFYP